LKLYQELRYERGIILKNASDVNDPSMMDEKEKLNRHLPGAKFPEDIVKYMWTVDPVEEAQRALHARA